MIQEINSSRNINLWFGRRRQDKVGNICSTSATLQDEVGRLERTSYMETGSHSSSPNSSYNPHTPCRRGRQHLTSQRGEAQHSQPSAAGSRGSSPDRCLRAGRGPLSSQRQKLQGDEESIYSLRLCLQTPATHPQFPSVTTHNIPTSQPGDGGDEQTGRWLGPELAF